MTELHTPAREPDDSPARDESIDGAAPTDAPAPDPNAADRSTAEDSTMGVELPADEDVSAGPDLPPDEDAVATINYTSGTTANPKGCVHRHSAIVCEGRIAAERLRLGPEDRFWTPLPFFHCGSIAIFSAGLAAPCVSIQQPFFEPTEALDLLEHERCTVAFPAFETIWMPVLNHPRFPEADLSALLRKQRAQRPQPQGQTPRSSKQGSACRFERTERFAEAFGRVLPSCGHRRVGRKRSQQRVQPRRNDAPLRVQRLIRRYRLEDGATLFHLVPNVLESR